MRLKAGPTQIFQAPFTVQASPGSHVYTFRSCSSESEDSSENEFDLSELRVRGKEQQQLNDTKKKVGNMVLMEHKVTKEDNLNKLALQYGCKVADIKRVNNFISEQDVYALKSIRIPVKIHSVLSDELRPLQGSASCSRTALIELPETDGIIGRNGPESQDLIAYFKGIDQSIQEAAQSTESALYLGSQSRFSVSRKDLSSGADWGIHWRNAVSILLLIGIIIPMFYIVYFKMQATGLPSNVSSKAFSLSTSVHTKQRLTATGEAHQSMSPTGHSQLGTRDFQTLGRERREQRELENMKENTLT